MRENMPGLARTVRMVDKSSRPTDTAFSIFSSASKRVSSIMAPLLLIAALCIVAGCHLAPLLPLGSDQRSDLLTRNRASNIAIGKQVEHQNRHAIVHTQTECGGIGHPQPSVDDFPVGDSGEHLGRRVHSRVL